MNQLVTLSSKEVANTFRWRSSDGQRIAVADMVDRHLFFTVRMLWNNFMPPEARVGDIRLYSFGAFYTKAYIMDAIRAMVPELEKREENLPQDWRNQIQQMRNWFNAKLDLSKKELGYEKT